MTTYNLTNTFELAKTILRNYHGGDVNLVLRNLVRKGKHSKPVQDDLLRGGMSKEEIKLIIDDLRAEKNARQIKENARLAAIQQAAEDADVEWKRLGFKSRGAWAVAQSAGQLDGGTNRR